MAKNDNLQDFLIDVADAIRAKKGTTDKINPQDFSSEIASIQSGVEPKEMKDVNFYDYDGTILYSYSWDEALQLTEMPPLPSHDGLICQGWNWTLEEMQANEGMCDVGAMYITDDGRTRLYISIEDEECLETPFYIKGYTSKSVYNVHWGDGNVEQYTSTTQQMLTHTYQSVGNYVISIESVQDTYVLGYNNNGLFGASQLNRNKLRKIEFSDTCQIRAGRSFAGCNMLESITMTMNQIIAGGAAFDSCGLYHVNLPRLVSMSGQAFFNCWRMESVSISAAITNIQNSLMICQSLRRCITPVGCVSSASQCFHSCYALESARVRITVLEQNDFYQNRVLRYLPELDDNIKSIGNSSFFGCASITSITIPSAVTSIAQGAFANCYSMRYYDFTKLSAVPKLDNANAFTGIPADCEIRVPMALVDEWKAATNWSTYADYIVGVEEIITFEDSAVETICLANWDTNGTGYLSKEEARAVTTIGTVFKDNTDITKFNELQYFGLKSLAQNSFSGCTALTSVIIPETTEYIYDYAFYQCSGLTSIEIPNSVKEIRGRVFYQCSGLASLTIGNSVTLISDYAFYSTGLTSLTIPNSVTIIGHSAFGLCPGLTSVVFSNSLVEIRDSAFMYCHGLTSVTIPNSVTIIKNSAFIGCTGLTSVTIGNSITNIGDSAFARIDNLKIIIINAVAPPTLGTSAIPDNATVYVPDTSVNAYRTATNWSGLGDIIKGISEMPTE